MSDKDIIIKSLERVERRIRTNRLLNEVALGATFFLAFPLALKVWDLFAPLRGETIAIVAGIWVLLFAAYVVWRSLRKATLRQAAAVIDKAAGLNDEIKTAFWFIHNPRPSEWIDVQIHRASLRAQRMNLNTLFPRHIPKTSYIAAGLFLHRRGGGEGRLSLVETLRVRRITLGDEKNSISWPNPARLPLTRRLAACCASRRTIALRTPATLWRASVTCRAQLAQVMPVMANSVTGGSSVCASRLKATSGEM